MSEADYMDDCQMFDLAEEHHRMQEPYEVVSSGYVVFRGTRAACWAYKRANGGFALATSEKEGA